ncbi:MAG: hypothetical protein GY861_21590 [bacterium]|nr:hypothetical protein [bacterium]
MPVISLVKISANGLDKSPMVVLAADSEMSIICYDMPLKLAVDSYERGINSYHARGCQESTSACLLWLFTMPRLIEFASVEEIYNAFFNDWKNVEAGRWSSIAGSGNYILPQKGAEEFYAMATEVALISYEKDGAAMVIKL